MSVEISTRMDTRVETSFLASRNGRSFNQRAGHMRHRRCCCARGLKLIAFSSSLVTLVDAKHFGMFGNARRENVILLPQPQKVYVCDDAKPSKTRGESARKIKAAAKAFLTSSDSAGVTRAAPPERCQLATYCVTA